MSKDMKRILIVIGALFMFLAGGAVGVVLMTLSGPVDDLGAGLIASKRIILKGTGGTLYTFDVVVESAKMKVDWDRTSETHVPHVSDPIWIGPGGTATTQPSEQTIGSQGYCGERGQIDVALAALNGSHADVQGYDPSTEFLAMITFQTKSSKTESSASWVYPLAGRKAMYVHVPKPGERWTKDRFLLWQIQAESEEPNVHIHHWISLRRRPTTPMPSDWQ